MLHKLYRKIYVWSSAKLRDAYLEEHGVSVRCPHCTTHDYEYRDKPSDFLTNHFGFTYVCHRCNKASYWNSVVAPVPLRCDIAGTPITKGTPYAN
ncbi:hypothetical protein HOU79_gp19 [Vibrio phage 1.224.A._10N.261.48.B1]|uniref:Uncharacterized protein n=1 Tax=Vibrio phage 1.224.A._10N.261.48.B1 TaxID=1881226 RepID=A0A2I7RRW1_9CAUD|nr:hypothetical protein HOU79_gp19 [Vibrio phage 1.224.A._10N.261.48.B1]AUR96386.1 hypothetical protein NVP1224A_19 [Vibrio phage 1.224.A._10N.261.48.B1]